MLLWGLAEEAEALSRDRQNSRYLPGADLPDSVSCTSDMTEALCEREAVLMAIPSAGVREVAGLVAGLIHPRTLLINAGKGLESDTGLRGSQVIRDLLGEDIGNSCVALSGPNLAVELAKETPTATVVASSDQNRALDAQQLLSCPSLRVYRNSDVVGVELGGALKNVIAIGAGISDGLGYGDNTKATLITRGLREMIRVGKAMGAIPDTFYGLSGLGDLMATSASRLSRNLRLGYMLGQGGDVQESLKALGQVAEGMPTCKAARALGQEHDVDMPITEQIYAVLFEAKAPKAAVRDLMTREYKDELR